MQTCFIDIDSSYEEIVVHVIGPESCVKDISVDEGDKHRKVLKISRGWKEDVFFFRPIAVSGGNVYTRAIIRLKIPEGTQPGSVFHLRGKGIPHLGGRGRGDQIVKINVVIPTKLTEKQKELLRQFEQLSRPEQYKERSKGFFEKMRDAFMS